MNINDILEILKKNNVKNKHNEFYDEKGLRNLFIFKPNNEIVDNYENTGDIESIGGWRFGNEAEMIQNAEKHELDKIRKEAGMQNNLTNKNLEG